MGERNRQRQVFGGFVGGVAEHEALVAGAGLVVGICVVPVADFLGDGNGVTDFGGLFTNGNVHAAGAAVKPHVGGHEPDIDQGLAHQGGDIHVGGGAHLPHHVNLPGGDQGFYRYPAGGILGQNRVKYAVGDGVADFIGMPFGDGFAGEQAQGVMRHKLFFRFEHAPEQAPEHNQI